MHPVMSKYISDELSKHDINDKKRIGFFRFLDIMWDIRKIMFMAFSHVFDTASDIAFVIELYILYQKQEKNDQLLNGYDIDMQAMFFACISIIVYYRISSSWKVFGFSHSYKDAFLQFVFDFYLIKLIYTNVFKMRSYSPLKILKIMRSIEGQNESGFQSILTMVFLIKTNFGQFDENNYNSNSNSNIIPILSFIFSFWSMCSRFIFLDFDHLQPKAQKLGVRLIYFDLSKINIWYLYHSLFRLIEVLFSILMIALIWVVFGGLWLTVIMIVLYLWLVIHWKQTSKQLLLFHNDFLAKLMVFDVDLVRIGLNLNKYIPYQYCTTRYKARSILFAILGCWLVWVRILLCCLIAIVHQQNNYQNINTETTVYSVIICIFVLLVCWFSLFVVAIKFYINRNEMSVSQRGNNNLDGIDIIKSNDKKSMLFCQTLKIDVFKQNYKRYKKYDILLDGANDVLDAMIISNDIENYSIVQEWFNDVTGLSNKKNSNHFDHFDHFLKHVCKWNGHTIAKLVNNCDTLDYYILIHTKLGLDMTLVDPVHHRNVLHRAILKGRSIEIIQWILQNDAINDINAVDEKGRTCLHLLMYYIYEKSGKTHKNQLFKERKIAQLLIEYGVDQNIKNNRGRKAKRYLKKMNHGLYQWLVTC